MGNTSIDTVKLKEQRSKKFIEKGYFAEIVDSICKGIYDLNNEDKGAEHLRNFSSTTNKVL